MKKETKNDIPIPKPNSIENKEKSEIKIEKDLKDLKKLTNFEKLEKEQLQVNNSIKKIYISLFIAFAVTTILFVTAMFAKVHVIVKAFSLLVYIPTTICFVIFLIIRLFVFGDFDRLKGKIVMKVSSNFIIANFFLTQKRVVKRIALINDDGISFSLGKKDYTIDYSAVWLDEFGYPNSYYIPNMPNPLKFDFFKYLRKGLELYRRNDLENMNEDLDVLYSSENLKIAKKDKFLKEMHRDNSAEKDKWMLIAFFGLIFAMIVIGVIVFLMTRHPTVIQVAPNVTNVPNVV